MSSSTIKPRNTTFGNCLKACLWSLAALAWGGFAAAPAGATTPQYDFNGNLKETQVPGGTLSYTYDALDRLKTEFGPGVDQTFNYDSNGNRTGDATHGYTITPNGNRIQAIDGVTVTYDPAGNILDDGRGKTYTYNAAGRLKEVRVNNVLVASYKYNYRGLRTHKITPQGTTLYHYDSQGHLIQTTNQLGAPKQSLHWADDQPISQVDHTPGGDQITYLHADQLNTPRTATNQYATVVWRWQGAAFGETSPTGSVTVNLRYPGQYYDAETGLYYNWNRYYDPKIGRYTSSDPIGLAGGLNTYTYVANNPLRYTDPQGRELILGGVGAVVGLGWGLVNGYLEGHSGWELTIDAVSGAAIGGLAGLTNGATLELTATRAIIASGIESYRQLANSAVSGCVKIDKSGIALAGAASIFGDLAGTATAQQQALRAAKRLHYNVPFSDTVLSTVVGGTIGGAIVTPYSAIQGAGTR